MRRFELLEPTSLREACEMLAADEDAKLIAGGTALLVLIKQGVFRPETLINLKKVQGASEISYDPERGLRLGALASIHHVGAGPGRPRALPDAGRGVPRGGEHPHPQLGHHRRQRGARGLPVGPADGAPGAGQPRRADQPAGHARAAAGRVPARTSTRRRWSPARSSRRCSCRRRRRACGGPT